MCKAHSKVTHIKQQKYFHHLKRRGYNKKSVLYPGRLRWWKYFCCFICVTLLWALYIVIKQQFFFIFISICKASINQVNNYIRNGWCQDDVMIAVWRWRGVAVAAARQVWSYSVAVWARRPSCGAHLVTSVVKEACAGKMAITKLLLLLLLLL